MDIVRIALIIACLVFLQSSAVPAIHIGSARPDLVLCGVVFLALVRGSRSGTVVGLVAGFLSDLYSPPALGTQALSKSVVGYSLGLAHEGLYRERRGTQMLLVFLAALLQGGVLLVLSLIQGLPGGIVSHLGRILGGAFYTALLCPFLFAIFERVLPGHAG